MIDATTPKTAPIDAAAVREIVAEEIGKLPASGPQVSRVEYAARGYVTGSVDNPHPALNEVLAWLQSGPVLLVGPAGAGKTFLAAQVARAMGREFGLMGAATMPSDLVGFSNAMGAFTETTLTNQFEHGGLTCLDELDACHEGALLALNAALANGMLAKGNRMVSAHASWACIATANTTGEGATMTYTGRSRLDGSTRDRFATIHIGYESAVEEALAGGNVEWLATVRKARKTAESRGLASAIGTYRAIARGAQSLALGLTMPQCVKALLLCEGLTLRDIL